MPKPCLCLLKKLVDIGIKVRKADNYGGPDNDGWSMNDDSRTDSSYTNIKFCPLCGGLLPDAKDKKMVKNRAEDVERILEILQKVSNEFLRMSNTKMTRENIAQVVSLEIYRQFGIRVGAEVYTERIDYWACEVCGAPAPTSSHEMFSSKHCDACGSDRGFELCQKEGGSTVFVRLVDPTTGVSLDDNDLLNMLRKDGHVLP
jgi:DNA-directed RNA polymerase subunit M/transcription elongation factor TFIIS